MATPLVVNDHVYGFMGVDLVDGSASWSDEDYRWLSSLANVISICLELRRAKEKVIFEQAALARSERLFKNIFANIPAGVEIYDKEGNLVDLNERDTQEQYYGFSCPLFVRMCPPHGVLSSIESRCHRTLYKSPQII